MRAGFAAVVLNHRPVAVSAIGTATVVTGLGVTGLLLLSLPFSIALLPLILPLALALSLLLAMMIEVFNKVRGAATLPEVLSDVARGIAAIHRDPRLCGGRASRRGTSSNTAVGDATQLVLMGNSSGGHILSLLATDRRWLDALCVPRHHLKACVDVSGVASFSSCSSRQSDTSSWRACLASIRPPRASSLPPDPRQEGGRGGCPCGQSRRRRAEASLVSARGGVRAADAKAAEPSVWRGSEGLGLHGFAHGGASTHPFYRDQRRGAGTARGATGPCRAAARGGGWQDEEGGGQGACTERE